MVKKPVRNQLFNSKNLPLTIAVLMLLFVLPAGIILVGVRSPGSKPSKQIPKVLQAETVSPRSFIREILKIFKFIPESVEQKPEILEQQPTGEVLAGISDLPIVMPIEFLSAPKVDNTFGFRITYSDPDGISDIQKFKIWIDTTKPQYNRFNQSIHAEVRKEGGQYKLFGGRYNEGGAACGGDSGVGCWENYTWDIGGFASGEWLYTNFDNNYRDTTSETANTAGRIRLVSATEQSDKVIAEFEVLLSRFFYMKEMRIYGIVVDQSGGMSARTDYAELAAFLLGNQPVDIESELLDDFEAGNVDSWQNLYPSGGGQISFDNEAQYLGSRGLRILKSDSEQIGFKKTFSQEKQGRIKLFFYDPGDLTTNFYIRVQNQAETESIMLAADPAYSSSNYIYQASIKDPYSIRWIDTGVRRTQGWHKLVFWVTPYGSFVEVDDLERKIFPYNLSSLPVTNVEGRRKAPVNTNLTRIWSLDFGSVWSGLGAWLIDEIRFENLPPNFSSNHDFLMHYVQAYLDSYGEVGSGRIGFDTYRSWAAVNSQWWFLDFRSVGEMYLVRYLDSNKTEDKTRAENIFSYYLRDDNVNYWSPKRLDNPFFGYVDSGLCRILLRGRDVLSNETKNRFASLLEEDLDYLVSTLSFGNEYIGNSTGEELSWPVIAFVCAASTLDTVPSSKKIIWENKAKELAMKAFSHNPSESFGFKTIYAPNDPPTGLMPEFDNGTVPRQAKYLFDNHDYHPHPNYALYSTGTSLLRGAMYYKNLGKAIPAEFLHNVQNIWDGHVNTIDFHDFSFVGSRIWRVRRLCEADGTCGYQNPYDQSDNSFRQTGRDDWGGDILKPAMYKYYKEVLGVSSVSQDGYTFNDISARADAFFENIHFDYIGRPAPKNVLRSQVDFTGVSQKQGWWYEMNRLNSIGIFDLFLFDETVNWPIPQICTPNTETRCNGNSPQICNSSGTGWDASDNETVCGAGKECSSGSCVDIPNYCSTNDSRRCVTDSQPQLCVGNRWVNQTACTADQYCHPVSKLCADYECDTGEKQCLGNILQTCNTERTGWDNQSCGSYAYCDNSDPADIVCRDYQCTGGDISNANTCSDTTQLTIDTPKTAVNSCTTGTKCEWLCADYYHQLNNTSCTLNQCTGISPSNAILCSGDGTNIPGRSNVTKKLTASCSTGTATAANKCEYTCKPGYIKLGSSCQQVICTANTEKRCSGNLLQTCNSTGTAWTTTTDCASQGQYCDSNTKSCQSHALPSPSPGPSPLPSPSPSPSPMASPSPSPSPLPLPGDVNNNGQVNVDDILEVLRNWLLSIPDPLGADVNQDNKVNMMDFTHIIKDWGK